jgi:hypothetical protein
MPRHSRRLRSTGVACAALAGHFRCQNVQPMSPKWTGSLFSLAIMIWQTVMTACLVAAFLSGSQNASGQTGRPDLITFKSGDLQLKGFIWKPAPALFPPCCGTTEARNRPDRSTPWPRISLSLFRAASSQTGAFAGSSYRGSAFPDVGGAPRNTFPRSTGRIGILERTEVRRQNPNWSYGCFLWRNPDRVSCRTQSWISRRGELLGSY